MTLIAHAPCPSCPSCSARADVLTDDAGYLIGTVFVCDVCGTWWVEMREQLAVSQGSDPIVSDIEDIGESNRKGVRS